MWIRRTSSDSQNSISTTWQTNPLTQFGINTENVSQDTITVYDENGPKVAFALEKNNFGLAVDGVLGTGPSPPVNQTPPTQIAYVRFLTGSTIQRLDYYPTRLSDAALEALTR